MRVVIAGGSGFLGSALVSASRTAGDDVVVLTRSPREGHHVRWDPADRQAPWADAVNRADVVINLAGEPMNAKRWTVARKQSLRDSRLVATEALAAIVADAPRPPVLLSSSGVGIYGTDCDQAFPEVGRAGDDFLARLCVDWESAALAAARATRVVLLRTGVVLGKGGGALPELSRPFRFLVGGPIGTGRQVVSWIHLDDYVGMVRWAMGNAAVSGPLNVTAPRPVTNAELARAIGRALHRPSLVPAPAFAVRLILGEMADAAVLNGQRAIPAKAQSLGYHFRYSNIDDALKAILG